jgi:hypothetical protein
MRRSVLVLALVATMAAPLFAQGKREPAQRTNNVNQEKPPAKVAIICVHEIQLVGKSRTTLLAQLFERAREELDRSRFERKSFVARLVSSIDDAAWWPLDPADLRRSRATPSR